MFPVSKNRAQAGVGSHAQLGIAGRVQAGHRRRGQQGSGPDITDTWSLYHPYAAPKSLIRRPCISDMRARHRLASARRPLDPRGSGLGLRGSVSLTVVASQGEAYPSQT